MLVRTLLIYLIFLPLFVFGQSKPAENYTLLWEVSGNNLEKPSFLFGSIHVVDSRAFEFSDSVLLALQRCDAFANEIYLDSILNISIDSFGRVSNTVNDLFYSGQQLGYTTSPKSNSYHTFLDAYLLYLAKLQGKKIYGLEALDGYFESLVQSRFSRPSTFQANTEQLYEKMITTYQRGDLNAIQGNMESSGFQMDSIFLFRNQMMANSIEKIAPNTSIFAVVGAGHLIGKNSVLALLRQRGFQVRAVSATFNNPVKVTNIATDKDTWHTIETPNLGFQFKMPIDPYHENLQKLGISANRYLSMDLGVGINYLFHHAQVLDETNNSYQYYAVENSFFGQDTVLLDRKIIDYQGMKGVEIVWKGKQPMFFKRRIFIKEGQLYELEVAATKPYLLEGEEVRYFFDSFQFTKPTPISLQNKPIQNGGCSVQFQGTPTSIHEPSLLPHPYYAAATDKQTAYVHWSKNTFQYLHYGDFVAQNRSGSDDELLESILNIFDVEAENAQKTINDITLQGYKGKEAIFKYKNATTIIRTYLRGNRVYTLLCTNPKGPKNTKFLDSFTFERFDATNYKLHEVKDVFTIKAPKQFKKQKTENEHQLKRSNEILKKYHYKGYEPESGIEYRLTIKQHSPYHEFKDLESFYTVAQTPFLISMDSLWMIRTIEQQDLKGKELIYTNYRQNMVIRTQFFLSGDHSYILSAYLPKELAYHVRLDTFFNSFELYQSTASKKVSLFGSKKEKLFTNLLATDTTIRTQAVQALSFYDFKKEDISFLTNAMNIVYSDDDKIGHNTKVGILDAIGELHNYGLVEQLKTWYSKHNNAAIRLKILSLLKAHHNQIAYDAFFDLLKTAPIPIEYSQNIGELFEGMEKGIYPNLIEELLTVSDQPVVLLAVLNKLITELNNRRINPQTIIPHTTRLLELLENSQQLTADTKEKVSYLTENNEKIETLFAKKFFTIFEALPLSSQFANIGKKYAANKQLNTRFAAISYLMNKKQKVKKAHLLPLLDNKQLYIPMIQLHHSNQQMNRLPKKHRNHETFAKAYFINQSFGDYSPDRIKTITIEGDSIINFNQKAVKIFIIKATVSEIWAENNEIFEVTYPGIVGPFPINPKKTFNFKDGVIIQKAWQPWDDDQRQELIERLIRMAKMNIKKWD